MEGWGGGDVVAGCEGCLGIARISQLFNAGCVGELFVENHGRGIEIKESLFLVGGDVEACFYQY